MTHKFQKVLLFGGEIGQSLVRLAYREDDIFMPDGHFGGCLAGKRAVGEKR